MRRILFLLAIALVLAFSVAPAMADTFGFYRLTNNSSENLAGQLFVDVTDTSDPGKNQVTFKFTNKVGINSSITDIYFDDGTLLGIAAITQSAGVNFSQPATPANLPSGNTATPPFVTTNNFSADSNPPITANGVNAAGEWVAIEFDLINGKGFADTIAAIMDGSLRIGLHVQSIGEKGRSDSYVNTVPLPGAVLLLGAGLARLVAYARRRQED